MRRPIASSSSRLRRPRSSRWSVARSRATAVWLATAARSRRSGRRTAWPAGPAEDDRALRTARRPDDGREDRAEAVGRARLGEVGAGALVGIGGPEALDDRSSLDDETIDGVRISDGRHRPAPAADGQHGGDLGPERSGDHVENAAGDPVGVDGRADGLREAGEEGQLAEVDEGGGRDRAATGRLGRGERSAVATVERLRRGRRDRRWSP